MAKTRACPESFLYAMGLDGRPQKIGYSYDPALRNRCFRYRDGRRLVVQHQDPLATEHAHAAEKYAHRVLDRYRADGEYFNVTPSMAVKAVNRAAAAIGSGMRLPSKRLRKFFAPKPEGRGPFWTSNVIFVRLPPYLYDPVREYAIKHDRSMAYVLRLAVAQYVALRALPQE